MPNTGEQGVDGERVSVTFIADSLQLLLAWSDLPGPSCCCYSSGMESLHPAAAVVLGANPEGELGGRGVHAQSKSRGWGITGSESRSGGTKFQECGWWGGKVAFQEPTGFESRGRRAAALPHARVPMVLAELLLPPCILCLPSLLLFK